MSFRRLLPVLGTALLVAGCFSVSSTLTLRPDGSGTVTERLSVSPQLAQMIRSMEQMDDSTAASDGLFTEEEIRAKADSLPGMRLESVTMLSDAKGEGYEAVYGFDNLNQAQFTPSPDEMLPDQASDDGPFELLSAVDLDYTSGSPATLTITMPRDTTEADTADSFSPGPDDGPSSEQEMRMMRQMMKNSGVRLAVNIDGEIAETNATHRSGNTITLIEMDFGALAQDSVAFQKVMGDEWTPASPEAAIDTLNALPGMTIEPQETVRVRFR